MTIALLAAASACGPTAEPSSPVERVVPGPARPLPPIRGLDESLIGLLGLDQRGAPSAVDVGATARFATLSSRRGEAEELIIHGFFEGTLSTEHTIALPTGGVRSWAWRTEDELVLLLADGSLRKVDLDDGKLARLARPAKRLFAVKKPGGAVERVERDEELIATAGEVWLRHCAWGARGGDTPCAAEIHVQVAPRARASTTAPAARAPWRNDPVPGWKLSVVGERPTGALRCRGPGGAVMGELPVPAGSAGYSAADAIWLSARPPIALVKLWSGEGVASDRFLARCKSSDGEPVRVEVGPSCFWTLGTSDGGAVLVWHGRVVGRLPHATQILFAP